MLFELSGHGLAENLVAWAIPSAQSARCFCAQVVLPFAPFAQTGGGQTRMRRRRRPTVRYACRGAAFLVLNSLLHLYRRVRGASLPAAQLLSSKLHLHRRVRGAFLKPVRVEAGSWCFPDNCTCGGGLSGDSSELYFTWEVSHAHMCSFNADCGLVRRRPRVPILNTQGREGRPAV